MRNNKFLKTRAIWGELLLLIMLLTLCGCSPSAKSEKEIIADLQQNPAFISETVTINDCEIIKRQTDKDNKYDLIYLTVYVNEDELKCALSYIMQYTLYNDGWILEYVDQYDNGSWSIEGLPIEKLSSDITVSDNYFSKFGLAVTSCQILNEGYTYDNGCYGKWFDVSISAKNSMFQYDAEYRATYQISGQGWLNQYVSIETSAYAPLCAPPIEMPDAIMDTLEYDTYTVLCVINDFPNHKATVFCNASNNYDLGDERFTIIIPLTFSLGESPGWTYDTHQIEESFVTVDWNIVGIWTAAGSKDDFGSWDVWLSIDRVEDTEDTRKYTATVSCDANFFWAPFSGLVGSNHVQCKTEGASEARITWNEPGIYELDIYEGPIGAASTFTIQMAKDGDESHGISWKYPFGTALTRELS